MIISSVKELLLILSVVLPAALANSESEKWSWPTSPKDRSEAENRKDIYYENSNNRVGKAERIRVPTSYDNERRPFQAYQVKQPATNRPKPLSDEFSDEFTSSGENYGNNVNGHNSNRYPSVNTPNRFGPQQSNDFPQPFGYGQPFPGAGGIIGGGPIGGFGAQGYPAHNPGHFQGGHYPGGNHISNGILVGPGGPTGIIGRPYGKRHPYNYAGGYPGGNLGFEGQHNGIGPGIGGQFGGHQQPFIGGPGHAGQFGGQQPFIHGFGQGYPGQFGAGGPYNPALGGPVGGPFPGQFFDSPGQVKKVQKSAE